MRSLVFPTFNGPQLLHDIYPITICRTFFVPSPFQSTFSGFPVTIMIVEDNIVCAKLVEGCSKSRLSNGCRQ